VCQNISLSSQEANYDLHRYIAMMLITKQIVNYLQVLKLNGFLGANYDSSREIGSYHQNQ